MSKKFRFTKEDLDELVIGAMSEEEAPEKGPVKPPALEMLLNKAKLKGEHGSTEIE